MDTSVNSLLLAHPTVCRRALSENAGWAQDGSLSGAVLALPTGDLPSLPLSLMSQRLIQKESHNSRQERKRKSIQMTQTFLRCCYLCWLWSTDKILRMERITVLRSLLLSGLFLGGVEKMIHGLVLAQPLRKRLGRSLRGKIKIAIALFSIPRPKQAEPGTSWN